MKNYKLIFAVCDTDAERRKRLRSLSTGMAIRENLEIQLFQFYGKDMKKQVLQYCNIINLVLISLDMEEGLEVGCTIARQNPDCYLLFYKQEPCDIEPLLWARPIAYYAGTLDGRDLEQKLVTLSRSIVFQSSMLHYTTRTVTGLVPYRSIVCVESDRKHLRIHLGNGKSIQLYQKLDDLEKEMSRDFCRVHQSWIINLNHLLCLDKSHHLLYLRGGEQIPVSRVYYEKVTKAVKDYNLPEENIELPIL